MTVKGMTNAMKTMDVEQISKVMNEFEKSFEDMDVRSGMQHNSVYTCFSFYVSFCAPINLLFTHMIVCVYIFQVIWKMRWTIQQV